VGKALAVHLMGGEVGPRTSLVAFEGEKNFCHCCESNSSSLVQLTAYFYVILGQKIKRLKFENYFTNWSIYTDNLAHVLDRGLG